MTEVLSILTSDERPVYRFFDNTFVKITKDSPIHQLYTGSAYLYYDEPLVKITPEIALHKLRIGSKSIVWQHADTIDTTVYNPLLDLNILINPSVTFYSKEFLNES